MLLSLGLIILLGFSIGVIFEKIKIPKIVGMIFIGILMGPSVLDIIDNSVLDISAELRQIALVIILTRAGLSLDLSSLKKIGRSAILMCFIPATAEIIGVAIFGPMLLDISLSEAILLGSVLAAVSPAIVVPRMIKLIENKKGTKNSVPELILAGASVDDIYVIILFYASLNLVKTSNFNASSLLQIPTSIILGIVIGIILGLILRIFFKKVNINSIYKTLILLASSFILIGLEKLCPDYIKFSALLSIMTMGIIISAKNDTKEIRTNYNSLWTIFEIFLFVLVGASVDLSYALKFGFNPVLLIFIVLIFRMIGVSLCLIRTNLSIKERLFCTLAYIPKATVQASIGGIALSNGLECGNIILTIAVLSIIITAPLGAILIDTTANHFLEEEY